MTPCVSSECATSRSPQSSSRSCSSRLSKEPTTCSRPRGGSVSFARDLAVWRSAAMTAISCSGPSWRSNASRVSRRSCAATSVALASLPRWSSASRSRTSPSALQATDRKGSTGTPGRPAGYPTTTATGVSTRSTMAETRRSSAGLVAARPAPSRLSTTARSTAPPVPPPSENRQVMRPSGDDQSDTRVSPAREASVPSCSSTARSVGNWRSFGDRAMRASSASDTAAGTTPLSSAIAAASTAGFRASVRPAARLAAAESATARRAIS